MGGESTLRLLIVAGEASGDAHASRLIDELRRRRPIEARGVAGPALLRAGVEPVVDMSTLNVLGFSGVIARLPSLLGAMRRLRDDAAARRPHLAVLVDSPGFNFRLGPALRAAGIPVFYYIAPQVWAWHPERAQRMAAWVDRLAVVFPFEERLFRDAGVDARFVGHPLLETLVPEVDGPGLRRELGVALDARLLGLLPGSRPQELRAHLPTMLAAAGELRARHPDLEAVIPLAPTIAPSDLERWGIGRLRTVSERAARLEGAWGYAHVLVGRTRAVQAHAAACIVCSGTATL
jgi:lipid-A-disaccharide synthase